MLRSRANRHFEAVGAIASLLVLTFVVYLGFFLKDWSLALLVAMLTIVLGAAIFVFGFLD